MNRSVAKYVPKGTNYCSTTSLITRVYIAAGIQLVGYHYLWEQIMEALGLSIPVQTELYLLDLDKQKLRNFCREHDFANMAKRKEKEHENFGVHIKQAKKDRSRDATYSSRTGCDDTTTDENNKRKGVRSSVMVRLCKYAKYGCQGRRSIRPMGSNSVFLLNLRRSNFW